MSQERSVEKYKLIERGKDRKYRKVERNCWIGLCLASLLLTRAASGVVGAVPAARFEESAVMETWRWRFARGFSAMSEEGFSAVALDRAGEWLAVGSESGVTIDRPRIGGAQRSLRVQGVRDLLYGPGGELLIASATGFWRLPPGSSGKLEDRSPGTGEDARRVHRVAAIERGSGLASESRVVLLATDGGAFVSSSDRRSNSESRTSRSPASLVQRGVSGAWQRLDAEFPSGPVRSVAITRGEGSALWLWALVESDLWRVALEPDGTLQRVSRVSIPHRPREVLPVEIVAGLPGVELVLVYPRSLSVLATSAMSRFGATQSGEFSSGLFQEYWPVLPPGASLRRVGAWQGQFWLATDRGLLTARSLSGPFRRAGSPAGRTSFASLAGTADHLYGAGGRGLLYASIASSAFIASNASNASSGYGDGFGSGLGPGDHAMTDQRFGAGAYRAGEPAWLPDIRNVQRAALAHLGLERRVFVEAGRGLARRGWLPALSLRLGVDRDTHRGWDDDQAFLSGDTRYLRDEDRDSSLDLAGSITMTWNLRDLAFDPEWIDLSREGRLVIALRDDVIDEINQLYFELRGLRLSERKTRGRTQQPVELAGTDLLGPEGSDPGDREVSQPREAGGSLEASRPEGADSLRVALRIEELTAGLDAWTGGWFSDQHPKSDASGP